MDFGLALLAHHRYCRHHKKEVAVLEREVEF